MLTEFNNEDDDKGLFEDGQLQFSEFRCIEGQNPPFVRVKPKSNKALNEEIYDFLIRDCKAKPPQLIISMNGGAKRMKPLNRDQQLAFKMGLVEVSKSAPTWIITSGFYDGVSKLVGEAAEYYSNFSREKSFVILGIGIWGAVCQKDKLENPSERIIEYRNEPPDPKMTGECLLDPNHDVFIFYDDGTEKKFGGEIEFRIQFEEFISQRAGCSIVQVIVEGGKNTLSTGANALKANIPVVVMKGSRRVADVICDVVESLKVEETIDEKLKEYQEEWKIEDSKNQKPVKDNLLTFHEYYRKKMVHLFNMKDFRSKLDTAILEAAFSGTIKGQKLSKEQKLQLAMTFNRADVAEKMFLEEGNQLPLLDSFESSLYKNQWQFVDFFLREGVPVRLFLTEDILKKLYFDPEANRHLNSVVKSMFDELVQNENKNKLWTIGKILKRLTDSLIPNMYAVKSNNPTTSCVCCESSKVSDVEKKDRYTHFPVKSADGKRIFTEHDLFIWALLTQRIEMAKIFWKYGKDHIGSALIAMVICKALQDRAEAKGEIEIMDKLEKSKSDFEGLAINILTEAYQRDHIRAHLLLIRALPYWCLESCLDIANKHSLINFLFHSACQTRLNTIWLGGIPLYANIFRLLANLPFGFLTSKLFVFTYNFTGRSSAEPKNNEYVSNGEIKPQDDKIRKRKSEKENKSLKESEGESYLLEFRKKYQMAIDDITFLQAVKIYYNAPVTKFIMNIISYITFLTIFSYVMIIELNTISKSPLPSNRQMEYALYVYYISFIIAEIREFSMGGQKDTFKSKFYNWRSSRWNWFDLATYIVFTIGFILRCTVSDNDFVYCRTIFALSLSMFYIRFMEFYYVQQSVGPKVIMISRMLKDVIFFLAIYLIALLAYGTFSLCLLYSNLPINSDVLKNIIYIPFWQLFGQVDLNYMEGSSCPSNICATKNAAVIVANAIFLLFANVLLLSLLIAMFGVTFTKVEEQSNRVWAFTRYRLIEEFYYRPILPPPFNVFEVFFHLFSIICCPRHKYGRRSQDEFLVHLTREDDKYCSRFEKQCMETYLLFNPLFSDPNAQESKSRLSKVDEDPSQNRSINNTIETHLLPILDRLNEARNELKTLAEKVHKIRRHQKKNSSIGRKLKQN